MERRRLLPTLAGPWHLGVPPTLTRNTSRRLPWGWSLQRGHSCGWNSVIEGVSSGLPFICWPYVGDHFWNMKYILLRFGELDLDLKEMGLLLVVGKSRRKWRT